MSLLVIYQGISIGRENLAYLSGKAAPAETRKEINDALLDTDAVAGVHDLAVFYDGPLLEVEAHVEVDGTLTLREAHDLESELVERVRGRDDVGDVHIHLDPSGMGEWKDADDVVDGPKESGQSNGSKNDEPEL